MPAYGVGVEHHTALERFSSKVLVHESRVFCAEKGFEDSQDGELV